MQTPNPINIILKFWIGGVFTSCVSDGFSGLYFILRESPLFLWICYWIVPEYFLLFIVKSEYTVSAKFSFIMILINKINV